MQATNMIKTIILLQVFDQVVVFRQSKWVMLPQTTASLALNMKSSKDLMWMLII
jgi:hypothetical protein